VQAPPVSLSANDCSGLLPEDWHTTGITSASLPVDKTTGGWMSFADAQTGQLDKANKNTADSYTIVKKCEDLTKAAAASVAPKPWWDFWG
jgi:hypothetical protein